jgi:hypothetical protein
MGRTPLRARRDRVVDFTPLDLPRDAPLVKRG